MRHMQPRHKLTLQRYYMIYLPLKPKNFGAKLCKLVRLFYHPVIVGR